MADTARKAETMNEALTQAMTEYAQAIRGDWSNFDGNGHWGGTKWGHCTDECLMTVAREAGGSGAE